MKSFNKRKKLSVKIKILIIFAFVGIGATLVIIFGNNLGNIHHTKTNEEIFLDRPYNTALEKEKVKELLVFTKWLKDNNAKGYIGEFGWPNNKDVKKWGSLATRWYETASYYGLWTSVWATGSYWGDYNLSVYSGESNNGVLSINNPQAAILESAIKKYPNVLHGINLAGMEFGNPTASATGSSGTDYFYESEASYSFLSSRGVKLIRIPISWERIEPALGGELNSSELMAISNSLDYAKKYGIKVILDLHNYGVYNAGNEVYALGMTDGSDDKLADTWVKLSNKFKDNPALLGYGIMNEPHDLGIGKYRTAGEQWENTSQNVLTSLRNNGDNNLIFIPGYDWSSVARWSINHSDGWIKDPKSNFRYEAHHYWDSDGSGKYAESYDIESKRAR